MAARRVDIERAEWALSRAVELSQQHGFTVWEVRALAEHGVIDILADSDPTRLEQAQKLATTAGMVGTVSELDMRIGETTFVRRGLVAAYPTILRAVTQARQLRLTSLSARANINLVECILLADQPVPGTTQTPGTDDIDAVVTEATVLADNAKTYGPSCALGVRAWLHGDSATAIRMIEEGLLPVDGEIKSVPWLGFLGLLRVVMDDVHPNEAFGPIHLTGHHANWAARAFGTAIFNLRAGQPAQEALAEAEHYVRHAPYWRHL